MNSYTTADLLSNLSRRTPCDDATSGKILHRIETEGLVPVDSGVSLHCWNNVYDIDGILYDVTGELSSDWKMVEIINPK